MKSQLLSAFALMLLAGCGQTASQDAGPGGVSAEDAKALDEAAAKLDTEPSAEVK